jgi:hypothetical protein
MNESKRRSNRKELHEQQLKEFLEKRDALFNNPSIEEALALVPPPPGGWLDPTHGPLATIHKARLQWLSITDKQIEESIHWLIMHNYKTDWQGAAPLTPETRDKERKQQGLQPLGATNATVPDSDAPTIDS